MKIGLMPPLSGQVVNLSVSSQEWRLLEGYDKGNLFKKPWGWTEQSGADPLRPSFNPERTGPVALRNRKDVNLSKKTPNTRYRLAMG